MVKAPLTSLEIGAGFTSAVVRPVRKVHELGHRDLGLPTCRIYGERRQPTRPEWVQEWLKTANLALAHTMMLSSYVEECGNLS